MALNAYQWERSCYTTLRGHQSIFWISLATTDRRVDTQNMCGQTKSSFNYASPASRRGMAADAPA